MNLRCIMAPRYEMVCASLWMALCSFYRSGQIQENTNGLVQQYFSKNASFSNTSLQEALAVTYKANQRPRKP
jgi:IS30 family transposase